MNLNQHFSTIKSTQMEADLKLINTSNLEVRDVLYEKPDVLKIKMADQGLNPQEISQLQAFRKRERAKVQKINESSELESSIEKLKNEKARLECEKSQLRNDIHMYEKIKKDSEDFEESLDYLKLCSPTPFDAEPYSQYIPTK